MSVLKKPRTDLQFIKNPDNWPRWPQLPLISRDRKAYEGDFCGIYLHQQEGPYIVYCGNIYTMPEQAAEIKKKTGKTPTWGDLLKDCTKYEYSSLEELLTHWRID